MVSVFLVLAVVMAKTLALRETMLVIDLVSVHGV